MFQSRFRVINRITMINDFQFNSKLNYPTNSLYSSSAWTRTEETQASQLWVGTGIWTEVWHKMKAEQEAHCNYVTIDLEVAASLYEYRVLHQTLRRLSGRRTTTFKYLSISIKSPGVFTDVRSASSGPEWSKRWKGSSKEQGLFEIVKGPDIMKIIFKWKVELVFSGQGYSS